MPRRIPISDIAKDDRDCIGLDTFMRKSRTYFKMINMIIILALSDTF